MRHPAGMWIVTDLDGGSYSPGAALDALVSLIHSKIELYRRFRSPVRLLVHYGQAFVYNTPYRGAEVRMFADVAGRAAQSIAGQTCFERIYLLKALEPGLEAFEIFPGLARCD